METMNRQPETVVMIATDRLGQGDEKLGTVLIRSAIKNMLKIDSRPDVLLFMNDGVKLCCSESVLLADLQQLVESGTRILVCGTCLDYYDLKGDLQVGSLSNMYDILTAATSAPRFVRL